MAKTSSTAAAAPAPVKLLSSRALYSLAFLEGALVIFAEMLGAKLLASYFGNSLVVWTAVISITIAALTLGYYVGGKLSARENKIKTLSVIFSLAAFFLVIMPAWSMFLFEKCQSMSLVSGSVISVIFLIGPAVLCLGISSPVIIQLLSEQNLEAGKSSGQAYAISTLAGIIATLLIGFYLLPNFGISLPVLVAALVLTGISYFVRYSHLNSLIALVVIIVGFQLFKEPEANKFYQTIEHSEGLMGQIRVVDQTFPGSETTYRLLLINGIPQTIIFKIPQAVSFWQYVHRISMAASLKKGEDALLLGMGGGSIANELQKLDFKLDIVDIDERMYDFSREYFYFKPKATTRFTCDDARHYLKTKSKKYDLLVFDVCSGEVQPSNLFTLEGIDDIGKNLAGDGLILIQYQEAIGKNEVSGSQSIINTFLEKGYKVYKNVEEGDIASIVIAVSRKETDFSKLDKEKLSPNTKIQPFADAFLQKPFEACKRDLDQGIILRDDKPNLELLNTKTIEIWRTSMNQNYGLKLMK
ncbi:MAG: fused MFS/spermidine synthase [Bacteroidota bacterium]